MQYFKGDELEVQIDGLVAPYLSVVSASYDEFFSGAYSAQPLGEIIFDNELAPLTNAIRRDVFLQSFTQIFNSWAFAGTFESYLETFVSIFGESVEVEFTIPDPGKLIIDITTSGLTEFLGIVREIEDNAYVYYELVDDEGDNIVFTGVLGLETEQEVVTMLYTMVPNGIYTEVSLTIGS